MSERILYNVIFSHLAHVFLSVRSAHVIIDSGYLAGRRASTRLKWEKALQILAVRRVLAGSSRVVCASGVLVEVARILNGPLKI